MSIARQRQRMLVLISIVVLLAAFITVLSVTGEIAHLGAALWNVMMHIHANGPDVQSHYH